MLCFKSHTTCGWGIALHFVGHGCFAVEVVKITPAPSTQYKISALPLALLLRRAVIIDANRVRALLVLLFFHQDADVFVTIPPPITIHPFFTTQRW